LRKPRSPCFQCKMYLADTHALLWYLTGDDRLGKRAKETFVKADKGEDTVIIPTIVLAESLFIAEKHKADVMFGEVLKKIQNSLNYVVYPLNINVVLKCQDKEMKKISEIHDRIIVVTAKLLNAKLITKDPEIRNSKAVECIWD